jgi:hypothetical protein
VKYHPLLLSALAVLLSSCSAHHYIVQSDQGTHLYLEIPRARSVIFASSSDAYAARAASRISETTWEITVPGRTEFKYFYIVDGKVYLPECRFHENDDFGSKNCIYRPNG